MPGETNEVVWRGVRPVSGIRGVWPAIDSVRVYEEDYQAGAGTNAFYTVPAGKILFISNVLIYSRHSATGVTSGKMSVRNVADVEVFTLCKQYYDIPGQQTNSFFYSPAIEVPAGYDVFLLSNTAALDIGGSIFGWLEDA